MCFRIVGFGLILFSGNIQSTPLYEHDVCNDQGWSCQRVQNCPQVIEDIKHGEIPRTCGFDGSEPIVCCPRPRTTTEMADDRAESVSSQRCSMYSGWFCFPPPPIAGGTPTAPKEFPHMAMIGYREETDEISWQCGGSLISERYVLTAAHCTFPSNTIGRANYVRLGDLNTASDSDDSRPQQFNIIQRINHPDYAPPELYNDIALYKLDRNVTFDEYVMPACLYGHPRLPQGSVVATGWGRIEFVGPVSAALLKVNLTQFEERECNRLLGSSREIPRGIDGNTMICAGERNGSRDTCQGDSGGPLLLQKSFQSSCLATQAGITSFGRQCGLPDSPGVYTRIAPYVSWIESVVWPDQSLVLPDTA